MTKPAETSKTNQFSTGTIMAIIAMNGGLSMRSVNVAELKNRLSKYLTFAKGGEEIVIPKRNLPCGKAGSVLRKRG